MKQLFNRLVFTFMAMALVSIATPALADTLVGVVNVQKIMKESKAAVSVRSQLETKQKSFQAELEAKEKTFYAEKQALVKEAATTKDKAAFEKKAKEFETKVNSAQRDFESKKAQIGKASVGAWEQIQTTVVGIVKDVATERKMNVVVTSGQAIYFDASLDVTAEVLKRLDAKLPSISVKF